jgi:hypothetical protein
LENEKYAEHIRSSSGILVLVAKTNDRRAGSRRGGLASVSPSRRTADGTEACFANQAIEVPEMRRELRVLLDLGGRRPNLVVRFGYGPAMPKSLRRRPPT